MITARVDVHYFSFGKNSQTLFNFVADKKNTVYCSKKENELELKKR